MKTDFLRVITWNVNSVRVRLAALCRMVAQQAPDVLCLQELKADEAHLPVLAFAEWGFEHCFAYAMKAHNGVAILSRRPLIAPCRHDWCDRRDARHVSASLDVGGRQVRVHNLYAPAGGEEPDPRLNDKFAHKLAFFDQLTAWFSQPDIHSDHMILVGDLNIAPLATDVWSHKQLSGVVSHTPTEIERLAALQATRDWIDLPRRIVPPEQKLYSWWSYRNRDFTVSDRGRRLDHIWATPPVAAHLKDARVLRDTRGWPRPSDHVPVCADFAF